MNLHLPKLISATILLALLCLANTSEAQFTWPGKFVCGYELGNVPTLSNPNPFPHEFEKVKPGNYATLFNILNLNPTEQSITLVASKFNRLVPVTTIVIPPFTTLPVGCPTITNATDPGSQGQFTEGFLIPTMLNRNFVVDVVYTYESKDAFSEHRIYNSTGSQGTVISTTTTSITGVPPILPPGPVPIVAGSGAGGLGLGASIDVERLPMVQLEGEALDHLLSGDFEP